MTPFFPNSMNDLSKNALGQKVDIIMRTKNRPILLVRALSSVLNQKHHDWQLYLVNDGGDPSIFENAIKDYLPAFGDKITVIQHDTSLGMEAASNSALKLTKGDFIVVHDDDDSWHPDFLEECVNFLLKLENRKYAGVITNLTVVMEQISNKTVKEISRYDWGFFKEIISYKDIICDNVSPPIAFVIRKDAANLCGEFNSNLPVLGDWDYILRILKIGDVATINKKLAYYHHRELSNTNINYSNTINYGMDNHIFYNNLYENALIRNSLIKNPEFLGIYRAIFKQGKELNDQIISLHFKIDKLFNNSSHINIDYKSKDTVFLKISKELKRWKKKYLRNKF